METKILGTVMPVLEVGLDPGESVFAESGELSWLTASIEMTTHTQMGGGGGIFGAIRRVAGGGTLFMTEYRAGVSHGSVAFAAKVPGHIVPVTIQPGHEFLVHRHGFLCATPNVVLGVGFQQSLGAGIFGGDGFMLQKVSGEGTAWLELSGELIEKELAAGETLRVHPGHVGAFQSTVGFQITMVRGIRNVIFGGDGLFLASLTGPGKVWLQTLPIARLASQIAEYLPSGESSGSRTGTAIAGTAVGGILGGIMGSMLGGDND